MLTAQAELRLSKNSALDIVSFFENIYIMSHIKDRGWLSPAADIVLKFQSEAKPGAKALAEILGLRESAVYRWMYPKRSGGTGGLIPNPYHRRIISAAKERDIPISAEDILGLREEARC